MSEEEETMYARVGTWLGAALSTLGVSGVIALIASDHRHRVVLLMVAVLAGMGAPCLQMPEWPWSALRARPMGVTVCVTLAVIIWWLAPRISTPAVRQTSRNSGIANGGRPTRA